MSKVFVVPKWMKPYCSSPMLPFTPDQIADFINMSDEQSTSLGLENARLAAISRTDVILKLHELGILGHHVRCATCGVLIDCRDLSEVFKHEHDSTIEVLPYAGSKVYNPEDLFKQVKDELFKASETLGTAPTDVYLLGVEAGVYGTHKIMKDE
ncbi:hypothetical protein M1M30_gp003 [Maribacter phage Colly_1]|uniref:Uncharacterized protein n=1 Tax=Maribacter phage Colly_1 TaxID=2745691 RepID=A0A8E4UY07_9CAUD|nr:hypothetical protein M1M30_gp003 [Maribacter phage Colly_1]QQO97311.1 hypothetical protein Colly1_3 [Maribacter phage Colly_1]